MKRRTEFEKKKKVGDCVIGTQPVRPVTAEDANHYAINWM